MDCVDGKTGVGVFFLTGVVGSVGLAASGQETSALGMLTFCCGRRGLRCVLRGLAFGGWLGRVNGTRKL